MLSRQHTIIIVFLMILPGFLPGWSCGQVTEPTVYVNQIYRYNLGNGTRLIIEAPQNGTPVARNQSLSLTVVLFNPTKETRITAYQGSIDVAVYSSEDLFKLDLFINIPRNSLFRIDFKDQNGTLLVRLAYPVILDHPSLFSNKDWFEAWEDLKEAQARKTVTVSTVEQSIALVRVAAFTMIIAIFAVGLAYGVKKVTKLLNTMNALNGAIWLLSAVLVTVEIISITASAVIEIDEDLYNYLFTVTRLLIYLLTFILVYIISYSSIPLDAQVFRVTDKRGKVEKDFETVTYYNHNGAICWARQDALSALARLLFRRHILIDVKTETGSVDPQGWKCFFDLTGEKLDMIICESIEFREWDPGDHQDITGGDPEKEKPKLRTRIRESMHRETSERVLIDPANAHDYTSKQFITDATAFDEVNEAYEEKDHYLRTERAARTRLAGVITSKMLHELYGVTIGEQTRRTIEKIETEIEKVGQVTAKETTAKKGSTIRKPYEG